MSDKSEIVTFRVEVLSVVPTGTYVVGQGKWKPKKEQTQKQECSSPPNETKKRKATRILNLSSDTENNSEEVVGDEKDCACIYYNDLYFRSKPREIWLKCLIVLNGLTQLVQMFQKQPNHLFVDSVQPLSDNLYIHYWPNEFFPLSFRSTLKLLLFW